MKTLNIFACGGAGQNIASDIIKSHHNTKAPYLAEVKIILVDTSSSNYDKNKNTFNEAGVTLVTIPGLDGSGQIRKSNVSAILPHIGKIVNDNATQEASLNIIISSLSGGSGSVLAGLITKELLNEGKNVIVMAVGDDTTRMFATNTLNSIKSFEAISKQLNIPVIMHYFQNNTNKTYLNGINDNISNLLLDYRLLFGGYIHGVDSTDLHNFLNYNKVTSVEPALTYIDSIGINKESDDNSLYESLNKLHGDDWYAISMVDIHVSKNSKLQNVQCDFRIDGEIEYDGHNNNDTNNLYFVLTDSYFPNKVKELTNKVNDYNKRVSTRVSKTLDFGDVDDSGLVL